jgi:hypothetical protein
MLIFSTLLCSASAGSVGWAQGFDPVVVYPAIVGTRPTGLALGDINGDGLLDIVAGDRNATNTTSVFEGQPGGLFGAPIAYPSVGGSWSLALGDVNVDGRLDLVTSANGPIAVAVQLGQPTGFGAMTTYQANPGIIQDVALGDINGDGLPDIVLANLSGNCVHVLLGLASGGFARATYSTGVNSEPLMVKLGDLNGDGRLDIVTANIRSTTIGVLLGQAGGFAPVVTYFAFPSNLYRTTLYFVGVALADVDGDNRLDVVATASDSLSIPTVGVLYGQANGLSPITYYDWNGGRTHSVAVGDVNNDGWPDMVLANHTAHAVSVLLGYPGGFSSPFSYSTGPNSSPYTVALGDTNNDGRLDIVTTNAATSSVGVLLNSAPATRTVTSTSPSSGAAGNTIALSGTNLQGAVAVVFAGSGNRSVSSGFTVNAAGTQITGIVVPSGAASGPVRVVTPGGTVTSNSVFTVLTPTAMYPAHTTNSLTIYPNPARASTMLALPAGAAARPVVLVDALGQVVRQQLIPAQADNVTLDLTNLPAGLYAVRCGNVSRRLAIE